jgi:2-oxoisovalerate dehydrogenase E1 component
MSEIIEGPGVRDRASQAALTVASPTLHGSDSGLCVTADESLGQLRVMMRSREFDRRAGILCRQGRAWFHISSAGHEALAGAVCSLRAEDLIFPHYRDRALLMARGMTIADMTRDLLATASSHSGGRNMSAHFSFPSGNVFSIASPVGSQCLPAAGAAWASRLGGHDQVVLCSIGDAATRQGEFYEAVSFAVDHDLAVIFLVSDNGYGVSTPTRGLSPLHKAVIHDSLVSRVDGTDVDTLAEAVEDAVRRARLGRGPTILWCELDRLEPHTSSDDHRVYRSTAELAALRDPVELYARRLIERGHLDEHALAQEWEAASRDVTLQVNSVIDEQGAEPATLHHELFASDGGQVLQATGGYQTIVDSVNATLGRGLREYPKMILFGEDIEDPKGGVFGFTKGLGNIAAERVVNSPLAEATIIGVAVGLAACGWRPVVELQFIDFIGPAWSQVSDQLATLRWRTVGAWSCPIVIYAPYGGYLPGGGIWHSQSNEALFTHLPGLRVAVASDACDVEAIFLDAFAANDPTLILLPKHLMRVRQPGRPNPTAPPGRARIVAAGTDVTVVTWGNGVELATLAAARLASEGVSVELIDLRWLAPWDRASVASSLRKTGRLVIVQEDNRTSSFGASLIEQLITADAEFFSLLAPPRFVARQDIHVPFHPDLERILLPTVDDVANAVKSVLPQSGGRA